MIFSEVAIDFAVYPSEFFLCELLRFSKSLNLFVCLLEKVHNEAETLVNKTRKVTDVFCGSVKTLLSLGLSGLQFVHLNRTWLAG